MRSVWSVVITLGAVVLLGSGCMAPVRSPRPLTQVDTGMRPQDIRVKPDQVTQLRVVADEGGRVMISLHSRLEAHHGFFFRLPRAQVKTGYRVDDDYDHDKNLTVRAQWSGRQFQESSRLPTYVHFVVLSLAADEAVLEVSARLVESQTGHFINLPVTLLRVQGADLAALTGTH